MTLAPTNGAGSDPLKIAPETPHLIFPSQTQRESNRQKGKFQLKIILTSPKLLQSWHIIRILNRQPSQSLEKMTQYIPSAQHPSLPIHCSTPRPMYFTGLPFSSSIHLTSKSFPTLESKIWLLFSVESFHNHFDNSFVKHQKQQLMQNNTMDLFFRNWPEYIIMEKPFF